MDYIIADHAVVDSAGGETALYLIFYRLPFPSFSIRMLQNKA